MGLKKFTCTDDIPEFPIFKSEEDRQKAIKEYIEAGAIPKKDLENGAWYIGQSRDTGIAQWWDKTGFNYPRYKIFETFIDTKEHFEDNTECDVFVPFKKVYPDDSY